MSRMTMIVQECIRQIRSAPVLCMIIGVSLVLGCFFRFHYLSGIYTEYDDVGVIGVYKTVTPGKRVRSLELTPGVQVQATIDAEAFGKTLLDSPYFPLFIGKQWTYPVGQYLIYPLLISEHDGYERKLAVARGVSACMSCVSMFLLLYLLYRLDGNKWSWRIVLPLGLLCFSFNSVLYAHHMSPYSITVTTLLIALIQFHRLLQERITLVGFGVWLGALTTFNYLILIMLPLFSLLVVVRFLRDAPWRERLPAFSWSGGKAMVAYGLVAGPCLLLFFRPGAGTRGVMPPGLRDGVVAYLSHFVSAILISAGSTLASFSTHNLVNGALAAIVLVGGVVVLWRRRANWTSEDFVAAFAVLFIGEWVALHAMHKLLLGPSRHVLVWLPLLVILLHLSLKQWPVMPKVSAIAATALIVCGALQNETILRTRLNRFDFEAIGRENTDIVLSYAGTFAPAIYFEGQKQCWNIDHRCFSQDYDQLRLPERFVLVSQEFSLAEYSKTKEFRENHRLFEDYEIRPLREEPSEISFTFNNQGAYSSNPNGFFMYELRRRETAEVATNKSKPAF